MRTYEYEVQLPIPELGARVWDVIAWRYPHVYLARKRGGKLTTWTYDNHWVFVLLKYEHHLRPLSSDAPRLLELARQVVGGWPLPRQGRCAPHLHLVR